MFITTKALFIGTIRYGDDSEIMNFFTNEEGFLSFMQKRRAKLVPLSLVEITFDYRQSRKLQYLRDMKIIQPLPTASADPMRIVVLMFLSEVLSHALKAEKRNEPLYNYLETQIQDFETKDNVGADFHIDFLLGLLSYLGYNPQFDNTLQKNLRTINHAERNRYTEILLDYYKRHLPSFPHIKSLEVLKGIFD